MATMKKENFKHSTKMLCIGWKGCVDVSWANLETLNCCGSGGVVHIIFLDPYRCHVMGFEDSGGEVEHILSYCTRLCQQADVGGNQLLKPWGHYLQEKWMINKGLYEIKTPTRALISEWMSEMSQQFLPRWWRMLGSMHHWFGSEKLDK